MTGWRRPRPRRRSCAWDRYVARAREALGLEARVYPEILETLNDVIRGMVFFLALVVPAAFFGERLFFAAADIRRQLLGLAALVLLIWMIISQVHPAFDIAHPLVIVLAFLIMAMAVLVMWMVSARFNRSAAEYRSRVAQVHRADISRLGAAYVAFMLGISNMRRRKLRTAMTLITLTLLTFSVLSFTSFEDRIRFVAMPAPFEGDREGLLIRDRNWGKLGYPALDYARSHFGAVSVLAPRYWHTGLEGGASYVEVRLGERVARALGMIGLAPGERLVTGVDRCLVAGSFFEAEDEASCLLPGRNGGGARHLRSGRRLGPRPRVRPRPPGARDLLRGGARRPARPRRRQPDPDRHPRRRFRPARPAAGGRGERGGSPRCWR